jgi:hypothetical protein
VRIVDVLEGCGQEAITVTGIRDVEACVKQAGFDGPGAAHAPPSGDHFLDDAELDAVGRLEAVQVIGQDFRETIGRFVFQDNDARQQGMAARVLRRDLFAGLRDRAPGAGAIGPRCVDSSGAGHR